MKLRTFAFLTLLFTWPTIVIAQVPLTKINQPIVLDGVVDEPIWDSVESLPIVQYEPVFRGGMSEESIFKVAYDAVSYTHLTLPTNREV